MKGFTIIEFLIVMAIVAILTAIVIPQCQQYTGGDSPQKQKVIIIEGGK
jgi:prepilin-type N-terminal cleavage/methylation domain-containing protein